MKTHLLKTLLDIIQNGNIFYRIPLRDEAVNDGGGSRTERERLHGKVRVHEV